MIIEQYKKETMTKMSQSLFVIFDQEGVILMDFVQNWEKFHVGKQRILVAVSTGVDSMCLLHLLLNLPMKIRPQIQVAYVDHQLREQSKIETDFIKEYCAQHEIPLHMIQWPINLHPKTGIEEQARKFRYAFFEKVMNDNHIKYLLTAHHADDQAETFMMKLLRGGQLRQLVGIRPMRPFNDQGWILRPLLQFSKSELRSYAKQNQLQFFEDETNYNDDVLRNRIRHQIIPMLKSENPQFLKHIQSYQQQLVDLLDDENFLVEQQLNLIQDKNHFDLNKLLSLNLGLQKAVIRKIWQSENLEINENQIEEIVQFLGNLKKPQGIYQINQQKELRKEYQTFKIVNKKNKVQLPQLQYDIKLNEWIPIHNYQIGVFDLKHGSFKDDDLKIGLEAFPDDLVLRHREAHDYLRIRSGHKKLRRWLIDEKIPLDQRDKAVVIASEHLVYAILGNDFFHLSQINENATIRYMIVIRYRKR